jgi:Copper resistance protein K
MKTSIIPAVLFAFATAVFAQGGPPGQQVIELKDGGSVVILKDGTTAHYDAAGRRVLMKDGATMEAKDGSKLMMKNNAIWRQLTEHGTLKPGH